MWKFQYSHVYRKKHMLPFDHVSMQLPDWLSNATLWLGIKQSTCSRARQMSYAFLTYPWKLGHRNCIIRTCVSHLTMVFATNLQVVLLAFSCLFGWLVGGLVGWLFACLLAKQTYQCSPAGFERFSSSFQILINILTVSGNCAKHKCCFSPKILKLYAWNLAGNMILRKQTNVRLGSHRIQIFHEWKNVNR